MNLPIFERKFYLDMLLQEFEKKNEILGFVVGYNTAIQLSKFIKV